MNRITTQWIRIRPVLMVVAVALSGCASTKPDPNRPDPLTGLPRRVPTSDRAVASTYAPERSESAVLTSANGKAPDGVSGLGIRDTRDSEADRGRNSPAANSWTGTESRSNSGPGLGGKLGAPATTASASARPEPTPGTGGSVRVRTFEEAQQFLTAQGVKWQDLQTTGEGEWKYTCSVPNKGNSSSMRTYEARDRYGLTAMQKVIDQIVRDQAR